MHLNETDFSNHPSPMLEIPALSCKCMEFRWLSFNPNLLFVFWSSGKTCYKNSRACHRYRRKFMKNIHVLQVQELLHQTKINRYKEKLEPKQYHPLVTTEVVKWNCWTHRQHLFFIIFHFLEGGSSWTISRACFPLHFLL